jgi:hypothetical protein
MRYSALVFLLVFLVAASLHHAQGRPVLDFELEDQFREVHRSSDFVGRVAILIGSDRHGVPYNDAWGEAIGTRIADHPNFHLVTFLAYADLRAVPFFLKGSVRGKFPQQRDAWVLLDWKGTIAKTYGFTPKASNVLVVAPDGAFVHHVSGTEPDEQNVAETAAVVRRLLDEVPGAGSGH